MLTMAEEFSLRFGMGTFSSWDRPRGIGAWEEAGGMDRILAPIRESIKPDCLFLCLSRMTNRTFCCSPGLPGLRYSNTGIETAHETKRADQESQKQPLFQG